MSLDMTDIIIAFTANREITGCIENSLPPRENEQFVTDRIRCCRRRRPVERRRQTVTKMKTRSAPTYIKPSDCL